VINPIASIHHKRILFSPLNWGWGHVTRSIPLIQQLIDQGNEVIICCSHQQEDFLRNEFPSLWYIPHNGYPFVFSGNGKWKKDLLKNYRTLIRFKIKEHKKVEKWVNDFHPHLILSDQRFGFYSKKVKSILITHQLKLPLRSTFSIAQFLNNRFLSRFDEIWVPDEEGSKISGGLSRKKRENKFYIGALSRLKQGEIDKHEKKYSFLGIVSGPSPYDQQFFNELLSFLKSQNGQSVVIVPKIYSFDKGAELSNVKIVFQPDILAINRYFDQSETVVSRAGYTTLLDLMKKGNKALLVPTLGQSEQHYLARIHQNHLNWKFVNSLKDAELSNDR
jgi:uncharacterized protein (TIGR00661 family)